jgi:FkbM family methyltransferase
VALALRREWLVRGVVSGRAYREGDVDVLGRFVHADDVVWDIGANSGTYTLALSRLAARVYAFEPVPHNIEILERVIRRAGLHNVSVSDLALSDAPGTARMAIPTLGFYGGYSMAALDREGDLPVSVATVDQLIADGWPEPSFIKCDVEGVEEKVVNGARDLIARRQPIWLLETFEEELLPLMQSLGYVAYANIRGKGDFRRVTARMPSERNYWFFPQGFVVTPSVAE